MAVAERAHRELSAAGIASALIGAGAMAIRGYVRATQDLDLAVFVLPYPALMNVERTLRAGGLASTFNDPEPGDPLGGVIRVEVDEELQVDVVNFLNPFDGGPMVVKEAIESAERGLIRGSEIPVVTIPHLVAINLYAGGPKSRADIAELLRRDPRDARPLRALGVRRGAREGAGGAGDRVSRRVRPVRWARRRRS